jgi:exodeoxyribonuclease V gamma subunit
VVDACATEEWCHTLGFHIGAVGTGDRAHRQGRRVAVAQKLAGLFTAYAAQRPALVRDWLKGDDGDLDEDLLWQPELFRRLRAHLGTPGPAERLNDAVASISASAELLDLPSRLSLFGPTRLTVDQLLVVDAIAQHRDVHLWLPHPSPGLWDRLADVAVVGPRRDDSTVDVPRHPLVSSLGRDTRELQLMLAAHTTQATVRHHPATVEPTSLLTRLQCDLHEDRPPAADHVLGDDDRSIRVHSCHGRLRQVEVMRELVLGLL